MEGGQRFDSALAYGFRKDAGLPATAGELAEKGVEGVQAVVLVPSRELALQIEQVFKAMATGFPVMSCYGGRPAMEEHRTMKGISPA